MTDRDVIAAVRALPSGEVCITGLTLYGEGSGTGELELRGIASAISNRVSAQRRGWGLTPAAVCLAPWQFSCWRPQGGEKNYERVIDAARALLRAETTIAPGLQRCLTLAAKVVGRSLPDTVGGSTHYLTTELLESHPPLWAKGLTPTVILGSTAFFAGVK